MGFDVTLLRNVLEQFVDFLAEESADLILERPRFAHAVVVITDGNDRAEVDFLISNVILHTERRVDYL